jgi:hypothetical protein
MTAGDPVAPRWMGEPAIRKAVPKLIKQRSRSHAARAIAKTCQPPRLTRRNLL